MGKCSLIHFDKFINLVLYFNCLYFLSVIKCFENPLCSAWITSGCIIRDCCAILQTGWTRGGCRQICSNSKVKRNKEQPSYKTFKVNLTNPNTTNFIITVLFYNRDTIIKITCSSQITVHKILQKCECTLYLLYNTCCWEFCGSYSLTVRYH